MSEMPPPAEKKSAWPKILVGCGVVALVVVLVCGGLIWYAAKNAARLATNAVRSGIVTTIESSELSDEDKQAIVAQVDRVVDAYQAGRIDLQGVTKVLEELGQSPLMSAAVVYYAERKYVQPSGLTDEEKAAAQITLQRVIRGIHEKQISRDELQGPLDLVTEEGEDGERTVKEQLSDDELKAFLASCKQVADDAGVPDEAFEIDVAQIVKEIVDDALGESGPDGAEAP